MFRQNKFNRTGSRVLPGRPRNKIPASARRFLRERSGNVMMMFGLTVIPLVIATGVAIDYGRGMIVKHRLAAALDATALAVGTELHKPAKELETKAQSYFKANYPAEELGVPGKLDMTIKGKVISLSASAKVDTAMMNLVGYREMTVAASTEVTRKIRGVEIVMVLDNTGSMKNGGKIEALKTAAKDLVDILFGDEQTPPFLKVGLVPFAAAVNVGKGNKNSGWIDTEGRSSVHGLNFAFTSTIKNRFDLFGKTRNKSWNGCVEARPWPMDIRDTPPARGNGDTLWVPYFAPDEPDSGGYTNSYVKDKAGKGWSKQKRQETLDKYVNKRIKKSGPHRNCSRTKPITPLTNNKTTIINAINEMNASAMTNIPLGLAWGWRVISPGSPFTEGAAYSDTGYRKSIILMTDGTNTVGRARNNHNKTVYGGYGYLKDGRLGTTASTSAAKRKLDERTAAVCNNIKNANADRPIVVYTITFRLNDAATKTLMRDCATDPKKYFDSPSNEVLKQNFRAIAGELAELRISK